MDNKATIVECVGMLAAAFSVEADEAFYAGYCMGLAGIEPEAIRKATAIVLQSPNWKFLPRPGQLRAICKCDRGDYQGRADIAWLEFDKTVGKYGQDYSVCFEDGLINATVRLIGGWKWCCEQTSEAYFPWLKKSFCETYVRLCEGGCDPALRRPLVGNYSAWNSGREPLKLTAAYQGEIVGVDSSQPVLLPAVDAPKQITQSSAKRGLNKMGEIIEPKKQLEDKSRKPARVI